MRLGEITERMVRYHKKLQCGTGYAASPMKLAVFWVDEEKPIRTGAKTSFKKFID